jgi:hypothetical protein
MITSDKPAFLLTHRVGFFCPIESNTPSNCITAPSLRLSALLTMSIYPHFSITLPTAFEAYSSSWVSCLDGASELHRATLLLRQPGHCHRHRSLTNCLGYFTNSASCLIWMRLLSSIELYRPFVHCSFGNSFQSRCLDNLAMSRQTKFEHRSTLFDLDETIESYRAAPICCPINRSY